MQTEPEAVKEPAVDSVVVEPPRQEQAEESNKILTKRSQEQDAEILAL